jgi:O-antigen/teichoic acid export membrane protein
VADDLSPSEATGQRAIANTLLRASGDIVGKLASLLLFAVMARELSVSDLGTYAFAFAFMQIALVPIEFGFDRYLLRRIAKDRSTVHDLFFDIIALKLAMTVPILAIVAVVLEVAGYGSQTQQVIWVVAIGFMFDAVANTIYSVFLAFERNGLIAAVVVIERLAAAAAGLTVLALGYGVVAVAVTYSVCAALGMAMASFLLVRRIGLPRRSVSTGGWLRLTTSSLPFGLQDVFSVMLFKLDAVILSLIATSAAVGIYSGAYRLLESTLFITYALVGAFAPMYTYLKRDSEPTIGAAFERSLKLALAGLVPIAIVLGVLAEPICRLFFGAGLVEAADPLRFLAPVVVLMGLVTLSSSLVVSRRSPMIMVWSTAGVVVINVVLNIVLIPTWDETGAAAAMLASEVAFLFVVVPIAARVVGGVRWLATITGPLIAGAVMIPLLFLLDGVPLVAVVAGSAAYLLVLLMVERLVAPRDVELATRMARRWLTASS